jgi:hypothetical protein
MNSSATGLRDGTMAFRGAPLREKSNAVRISVSDTGIGFENAEDIFTPWHKGSAQSRRKYN